MRARDWAVVAGLCLMLACQTTKQQSTSKIYVLRIEAGDSLASLAQKYDTSSEDIMRLNGLGSTKLKSGQIIKLAPGPLGIVADEDAYTSGHEGIFAGDSQPAPGATLPPKAKDSKSRKAGRPGLLFGQGASVRPVYPQGQSQVGGAARQLLWPVHGEVSSGFGRRGRRLHTGLDIRAPRGTSVQAAGAGRVEFAGSKRGYGNMVVLRHARLKTAYAHLDSIAVDVGEQLVVGQEIGTVGDSGNATGYHLHFEVRTLGNKPVDPWPYLEKPRLISSAR